MDKRGFSYIEVLIALAIFSIALVAILPILAQSGRNQATANTHYAAHLQAQSLMYQVRHIITDDAPSGATALSNTLLQQIRQTVTHSESAFIATHGDFAFVVYLVQGNTATRVYNAHVPDRSFEPPASDPAAFDFSAFPNRTGIVVFIYNAHGHLIGRAIGVA